VSALKKIYSTGLKFSYWLQMVSVFQKQLKWSLFQPDHLTNREKEEMGQGFYNAPWFFWKTESHTLTLRGNGKNQTLQF